MSEKATSTTEKFQRSISALVDIHGTRGTARLLNMPPATVSRIARSHQLDLATAQDLYAKIGVCACCGHVRRSIKTPRL